MQTLTLNFHDTAARILAAQVLAHFVREGVGFKALPSRDECELIVTFTGAF